MASLGLLAAQASFADLQLATDDPYHDTIHDPAFTSNNSLYKKYRGNCTWYVEGRCLLANWNPNYLGDAGGWFSNVSNGSAKDQTPQVGAIECDAGHVRYVDAVIDQNHWIVSEYNFDPAYNKTWDQEEVTRISSGTVATEAYPKSKQTFYGFIHPPTVSNGLYKSADSSDIFAVQGNVRRVYTSWDEFLDLNPTFNGSNLQTVPSAEIFERTYWAPPFPFIPLGPDGTVWYCPESFGDGVPTGARVSRGFTSANAFYGMGFSFADCPHVSAPPYQQSWFVTQAEPYLIATDGPYAGVQANRTVSTSVRIRNLSTTAHVSAISIRMIRQDGAWFDMPWGGPYDIAQNQEVVLKTSRTLPAGTYTMKVIYSYWNANGHNIQLKAYSAGLYDYPDSFGVVTVR